jgi:hypothetical protein
MPGGDTLRERILGRTGLKVRVLGFGGIPIQRVSEEEAIRVVRRGYELGVNYFDTARMYTVSEERIGKALEDVRDEVILATKSARRTREGVLEDLEVSLRELRTDWIDIYQLHSVLTRGAWEQIAAPKGALEALYEARDEGKIHHLGITSHSPELLTEIVKEDIFEVVLVPYNYLTTKPTEELLSLCHGGNVGTVIMKPFGGGALSNAGAALKYILANEDVDVVIPGMMSTAEVEENVAIGAGSYALSSEDLKIVERDRGELGGQFCHGCDYCQPCPQGIPISFVLRAEMQLLRLTGWTPQHKRQFQVARVRVPTCLKCGACESKCPYQLPIRELLPAKMASLEKRAEGINF